MSLDALAAALPEYAEDIRRNLRSVLGDSPLTEQQAWGAALACAVASRDPRVLAEIADEASGRLSAEAVTAAKAAASIMAMSNVYYRAKHLIGDDAYAAMPARLAMRVTARPGVDKLDFELWALAVSAIGGCGACLETHEKRLRAAGVPAEAAHEALRIAAVVHAVAVTLGAERVLS
ncbi:carboxymuconolactone decarboxylase family protein [Actinokineospora fastidiosa]|uniref:Alkyl hydroperoxide reductase AhpD n=1 Tax=Actinokineospora fastidiosa TaxID=1816 RepID=A0A918G251_9PSEU|nr:carboxymuconolactone decarboxylase family protein [Actinokineospora fastidiosa]GGS15403.1 alkyl hydroperoxide reductase AhpD [Actinokineospora fastidiosa]